MVWHHRCHRSQVQLRSETPTRHLEWYTAIFTQVPEKRKKVHRNTDGYRVEVHNVSETSDRKGNVFVLFSFSITPR